MLCCCYCCFVVDVVVALLLLLLLCCRCCCCCCCCGSQHCGRNCAGSTTSGFFLSTFQNSILQQIEIKSQRGEKSNKRFSISSSTSIFKSLRTEPKVRKVTMQQGHDLSVARIGASFANREARARLREGRFTAHSFTLSLLHSLTPSLSPSFTHSLILFLR